MNINIADLFENATVTHKDDHSLIETIEHGILLSVADEHVIYSMTIVRQENTTELTLLRMVNTVIVDASIIELPDFDIDGIITSITSKSDWNDEQIFDMIEQISGIDNATPDAISEAIKNACS